MRILVSAIVAVLLLSGCTKDNSHFTTTDQIYIPNTFNPYSYNNEWKPVYNAGTENPEVRWYIFDRDGIIMYQAKDFLEGWNGNYDGRPMPSGTYSYHVILDYGNPGVKEYAGPLFLVR